VNIITQRKENNGSSGTRHKITHSYTAQYAVAAVDKLLHTVVMCLQERSGAIDPLLCEELKTSKKCGKYFRNCDNIRQAARRDIRTVFGQCK
jgi:hypothetical protein